MQELKEELPQLLLSLQDPTDRSFQLHLSPSDSPLELKACLQEFAYTSYFTQYHFEVDGRVIKDYEELGQQEVVSGAVLRMKGDDYNIRGVKTHVERLLEILENPPSCMSYLIDSEEQQEAELQVPASSAIPAVRAEDFLPDPSKLPNATSLLHPLSAGDETWTLPKCVHSINYSLVNPPTSKRKLCGDIFYLDVQILEGAHVHITAACTGFFVNGSRTDSLGGILFDPEPPEGSASSHTLVGLLEQVSPSFKANLPMLFKSGNNEWENIRHAKSILEVEPWVGEDKKRFRGAKLEDGRDWNEELQVVRSLPGTQPMQRIQRDKNVAKIYSDFLETAIAGARTVIAGGISPLNPMEMDKTRQIFIQNNIFFSFTDDREYEQEAGGDVCATHVQAAHDLRACRILNSLEIPGLHTIGTALIDFRGMRVMCQTILPGIMSPAVDQIAKYGSMDEGQTIHTDPDFHEIATAVGDRMHLTTTELLDNNGKTHTLALGYDVKGFLGADNRKYFLENGRIFPRDANKIGPEFSFCLIRPELIEHHQQSKNRLFIDAQIDSSLQEKRKRADEPDKVHLSMEELTEIVATAPKFVFNPNAFTSARLASPIEKEEEQVRELASFLRKTQIPVVSRVLCSEDGAWPRLGISVVDVLHQFGVNARYLGTVASEIRSQEKRCVKWQCEISAAARATKHIFNKYIRAAPDHLLATVIAHLLNCVFNLPNAEQTEEVKENKRKRRKHKPQRDQKPVSTTNNVPILNLGKEELWREVANYARKHFELELTPHIEDWEAVSLPCFRTYFLREICLQTGIQLAPLSLMEKFTPDSISSLTHRVKSLDWRNADSKWLYESAIKAINEKNNPQAVDLLVQSATIQANVSGPIHKDIGMCYQRMSNIYFAEGKFTQAIVYQHKAIIIFERALGLDHPVVAQSYITLSYLYQTVGRPDRSFKHIIRACDLFALNGCENSTEAVHALSTLAVLYTEADMHEFAIWTIHRVLDSYVLLNGEMHISVGECCQILASEYRAVKEYEKAVHAQARALSIFKQTLPATDKRIKDTKDLLEAYTRQITGVDLVPSSSSRSQKTDKLVKSDRNSTLRQRLYMRKLQAKMNVPRSQLHLTYGDMHPQYTQEQIEEEKTRLLIEEITRKNARK